MKILLLGGTGAMGSSLSSILNRRDYDVFVTSRNYHADKDGIHYLHGNAKDEIFLKSVLRENWDAIVDFMIYPTEQFAKIKDLLLASTGQYIFISSSRIYADSDSPLTENSPRLLDVCTDQDYLSTDEYALCKARSEDILNSGKVRNYTIVRPYITYNNTRLQLCEQEKEYWLYRALNRRTVVCSEDIFYKETNVTYGGDVARCIACIIGNPKTLSEVYNIVSDTSVKWNEIFEVYSTTMRQFGYELKLKLIPNSLFLRNQHRSTMVKYDRMYNRVFNNSKIKELTKDIDFKTPNEGLKDCLASFLSNPSFNGMSIYDEAIRDRLTNEFISFREIESIKSLFIYLKYKLF